MEFCFIFPSGHPTGNPLQKTKKIITQINPYVVEFLMIIIMPMNELLLCVETGEIVAGAAVDGNERRQ